MGIRIYSTIIAEIGEKYKSKGRISCEYMKKKSTAFAKMVKNPAKRGWKTLLLLCGGAAGLLGGLFGSGGGVAAALALRKLFPDRPERDRLTATLCTVLPSAALAAAIYAARRNVSLTLAPSLLLSAVSAALAGGLLGAALQTKLRGKTLRLLFSAMLTVGGGLLLFR